MAQNHPHDFTKRHAADPFGPLITSLRPGLKTPALETSLSSSEKPVHLHAGGLDDLTVSFEVVMNASFEFIE